MWMMLSTLLLIRGCWIVDNPKDMHECSPIILGVAKNCSKSALLIVMVDAYIYNYYVLVMKLQMEIEMNNSSRINTRPLHESAKIPQKWDNSILPNRFTKWLGKISNSKVLPMILL